MKRWIYSSSNLALLVVGLAAGVLFWTGNGAYGQSPAVREALELIEKGIDLAKNEEPEAAISRFKHAEELADDDPSVQFLLGKGYESVGDKHKALLNYFKAALTGVRNPSVTAVAAFDVRRVMSEVPVPASYRSLMESGNYSVARDLAPWMPAAYWAIAMQSNLDGKRAEASNRFKDFQMVMEITGLAKPYREWTIETEQVRYQIGKVETDFLIEAGFLDSSWQRRIREGDRQQIAQVFGAIDPELWDLSGEAMRYAYRFKTVRVSKSGAGDFITIQQAIDELNRAGGAGQILVDPGTYRESLDLAESGRIVIRATDMENTLVASPSTAPALSIRGGLRIVIDGLRFETERSAAAVVIDGARQVTLKHVQIKGGAKNALRITDARDIFIWLGAVSNAGLALRVERSSDVGMAGIKLHSNNSPWAADVVQSELSLYRVTVDATGGGILARGRSGEDCASDCSSIMIDATSIHGESNQGIALLGASNLTLNNSRITGALEGGIYGRAAQISLDNNIIEIDGKDGIVLQGGGTAHVTNSLIRANRVGINVDTGGVLLADSNNLYDEEIGIQVLESSANITNNELVGVTKSGIFLRSPREPWSVSSNMISGSESGIAVELAPAARIFGASCGMANSSKIAGNTLTWNGHGIVLGTLDKRGGGFVCVEQNTLVQNNQTGIWLLAGGPATVFRKGIVAFNNIGILDPDGSLRVEDSAGYQNGGGDIVPVSPSRGQALLIIDPKFKNSDDIDYRVGERQLIFNGIGASSK